MGFGKIAGIISLLIGLLFVALWIDGSFYATELRLSVSRYALRIHWGGGAFVVAGTSYNFPEDRGLVELHHVPHTESFNPYQPGLRIDAGVGTLGVIYRIGYGLSAPHWLLTLLFLVIIPAMCFMRSRGGFRYTTCPNCHHHLKGRFGNARIECPECGRVFLPLPSPKAETLLTQDKQPKSPSKAHAATMRNKLPRKKWYR